MFNSAKLLKSLDLRLKSYTLFLLRERAYRLLKALLLAVIIIPLALVTAIFRLLILPGIRKIRKYYGEHSG